MPPEHPVDARDVPTRRRRSLRPIVAGLGVVLGLSGCGSSPPGLLTGPDIPGSLGVKANAAAAATEARQESPSPHCKRSGVAVFSVPGQAVPVESILTSARSTWIVSVEMSCTSASAAHVALESEAKIEGGHPVAGIADEAQILDLSSAGERAYIVAWRADDTLGALLVVGPKHDTRIDARLAQLLARRAAARS